MNKKHVIGAVGGVLILAIGFLMLQGQSGQSSSDQSSKLQVAASFYPIYFFTSQIAGNKGNVVNVTPASAEPHDYEPTAGDIGIIENSRLLVLNGGGLEAWGANIQPNINPNKTLVVNAGEGLATQQIVEDGETMIDPHGWLNPVLAERMVDKILAGLSKVDADNADYYAANAVSLKQKLAQIDAEYKAGLQNCAQKNIVTSHAAFGYLATQYGLHQVAISGLSPDAEPSPKELGKTVDFVKKNNVKYIFFESLVSPKLSQTIASETGAETLVLNPIEGLTPEEVAQKDDYLTVMRKNLANLQIALQCQK